MISHVELVEMCYFHLQCFHYLLEMCQISCEWFILFYFIYFRVLRRFQHCTGHITTGSWKGRGNQYI